MIVSFLWGDGTCHVDRSSLTRDQTFAPAVEARSHSYQTARQYPQNGYILNSKLLQDLVVESSFFLLLLATTENDVLNLPGTSFKCFGYTSVFLTYVEWETVPNIFITFYRRLCGSETMMMISTRKTRVFQTLLCYFLSV